VRVAGAEIVVGGAVKVADIQAQPFRTLGTIDPLTARHSTGLHEHVFMYPFID
jgi:hypothetical protein